MERTEKMTLRLTMEERWLRDALAEHHGTDGSSIMRQGLRKMARSEGIVYPGRTKDKIKGRAK